MVQGVVDKHTGSRTQGTPVCGMRCKGSRTVVDLCPVRQLSLVGVVLLPEVELQVVQEWVEPGSLTGAEGNCTEGTD